MTLVSFINRTSAVAMLLLFTAFSSHAQVVEVLSKDANGDSAGPVSRSFISGNGRFVVFHDFDLLPAAPSNRQVYLRDRMTGDLELISVSTTGGGANANTDLPQNPLASPISEDGRYVLFKSVATNLVSPAPSPGIAHLYLRDRDTNQTTMISVDPGGSPGDGSTGEFTMSPNGEFFLFESAAENLDPADSNGQSNLFVHIRATSDNSLACYKANGDTNTDCRNFTIGDTGIITFVSGAQGVILGLNPSVAQLYVGLPGPPPTMPFEDIHELVSRDATMGGAPADKVVDGGTADREAERIAFFTEAALTSDDMDTETDLYVYDRPSEGTTRVVDPTGAPVRGNEPRLSHDGNWLAFETDEALDPLDPSRPGSFPPPDVDVYLLDYRGDFLGPVYLINKAGGQAGNARSLFPSVSNDGVTTFQTGSDNLVPNDTGQTDVFAAQPSNTFADNFGDGTTDAWDQQEGNSLDVNMGASASPDPDDFGLEVTPRGSCADPVDRLIEPPPAQTSGDFLGCSTLTAQGVEIVSPGSTFTAGESILLGNDFQVAAATPFTALLDSSQAPFGFLEDQSPGTEATYSARFWMNLNTLSQGGGERLEIFAGYSAGGANPFSVFLEPGGLLMRARDGAGFAESAFPIVIPAAAWFEVIVTWKAGSGDGEMTLSIDRAMPFALENLSNSADRIDTVRLGAIGGMVDGTSGSFFLDDFLSWR